MVLSCLRGRLDRPHADESSVGVVLMAPSITGVREGPISERVSGLLHVTTEVRSGRVCEWANTPARGGRCVAL